MHYPTPGRGEREGGETERSGAGRRGEAGARAEAGFRWASKHLCRQISHLVHPSEQGTERLTFLRTSLSSLFFSVGLWRGLNVQANFTTGEILMNFTESSVTFGSYPLDSKTARIADVAMVGDKLVRLTFTSPESLVGVVKVVSYTNPGWPTGPESRGASFAVPRDDSHQTAPSDVRLAMGDSNFDVYSMQQCNSWVDTCDFAPAFDMFTLSASPLGSQANADACSGFDDCVC